MKLPYRLSNKTLSLRHLKKRHLAIGAGVAVVLLGLGYALWSSSLYHERRSPTDTSYAEKYKSDGSKRSAVYAHATVLEVLEATADSRESVRARITTGPDTGKIITVDRGSQPGDAAYRRPPVGSDIYVYRLDDPDDSYSFADRNRLPGVTVILGIMVLLVLVIGRRRGLSSIIGLSISVIVLALFVVPRIVAGHDAYLTCIQGAFMIAVASIFVAHGFTKRTAIAFLGTIGALIMTVFLSNWSSAITYLTGLTDEESMALVYGGTYFSLPGLLFGGIIIASLGVLNDITVGQSAAVDEIYKANPKQDHRALYRSGMSVGREHIAALVNTLALAYMGVALPSVITIAYFSTVPFLPMVNYEIIAIEIVRTAVISIGTLLAVPLTTALAAYILPRWYGNQTFPADKTGHHHLH